MGQRPVLRMISAFRSCTRGPRRDGRTWPPSASPASRRRTSSRRRPHPRAAAEGAVNGIMSFAVSLTGYHYKDYSVSADFIKDFIQKAHLIPKTSLLYNINIPPLKKEEIQGVRWTRASQYSYLLNYDKGVDPFGEDFYWLADFREPEHIDKWTDDGALSENYISITPLLMDRTDYKALEQIQKLGDIW